MSHAQLALLKKKTITPAQPPEPRIELRTEAVALLRYPARCLTHKCPLLPSELDPALRTYLREHFGVHAMLYPPGAPTAAPMYLQPHTEPTVLFHELLSLATISEAIVVTNASTPTAGMAMALAYEHAPGRYKTKVALGVGTSQDGEAPTLVLCAR